jgi:hypothetical protein
MAGYDGRGARFPLTIVRGADMAIELTVTSGGSPVNLSAATIEGDIYPVGSTTAAVQMADALTVAGSRVIVCTIAPSTTMDSTELDAMEATNTYIRTLANDTTVFVAETGTTLTTGDGRTRNAALYVDGAHPNDAGQLVMGAALSPVITDVLAMF